MGNSIFGKHPLTIYRVVTPDQHVLPLGDTPPVRNALPALLRVVQSPRLTVEQRECLKNMHTVFVTNGLDGAAWELRAAFPDVFGKEG